jgi:hypothetical protein
MDEIRSNAAGDGTGVQKQMAAETIDSLQNRLGKKDKVLPKRKVRERAIKVCLGEEMREREIRGGREKERNKSV